MRKILFLNLVLAVLICMTGMDLSWAGGGEGRMPNPKWAFLGSEMMNGVTVVYGANPGVSGCKIQSKWHQTDRTGKPNPGAQVVITNREPGCDKGSAKFNAAMNRALSLGPVQCPTTDCNVAEH
ncbi:MAG: hypothetical protein HGB08_01705 [Candidatus Moranbacteria bacterium]|nr:hypothetical protein [Candidatus Moranbacteria bacterium]